MRGNIRRRAPGTWTIQVYLGKDSETRKKRYVSRTVRGTKKQAEAALAQLVHAVETGLEFDASRLTVAEYLEKWLDIASKRVRRRTHLRYAELLRLHVVPVIGHLQLSS